MTEIPNKPEAETAESRDPDSRRRFEDLPPAAQRALHEAEQRRAEIDAFEKEMPREIDGRGGKEPVRYGDWEKKGIAVDF